MPRYSIQHPETKLWSCFSTIVDDFICDWMTEEDYIDWLLNAERERIIRDFNLIKDSPNMTYDECIKTIEFRKECSYFGNKEEGAGGGT